MLITSNSIEQLLGAPILKSCSGKDQAEAVFHLLAKHDLTIKVQALCFDTTAANAGRFNGSCHILEQKLEQTLMYFPCRHHVY